MIGKRRVTFHLNFKKVHYVKITYVIKFTISRTYLYLLLSVEPLNITWSVHCTVPKHCRLQGTRVLTSSLCRHIVHTKLNPSPANSAAQKVTDQARMKMESWLCFIIMQWGHDLLASCKRTLEIVGDRFDLTCNTSFTCRKQSTGRPWFFMQIILSDDI